MPPGRRVYVLAQCVNDGFPALSLIERNRMISHFEWVFMSRVNLFDDLYALLIGHLTVKIEKIALLFVAS